MRQLIFQVPQGRGSDVLAAAEARQGTNMVCLDDSGVDGRRGGRRDVVVVHVPNRQVEGLLQAVDEIPELYVTLVPRGMMPLQPPASEAARQVKEVQLRSPLEIFLAGLQSVGSWTGFLGYAASAGVTVWIGLFTNTTYLLTAAMLIAPFAGPAMNTAIATARGDAFLLGRSVLRYATSLGVAAAVAGVLSVIMGQESPTALMMATFEISSVTVLLPLVAGTAGALNLIQSERSSLVSGAAVGVLVAASLAPAAGLVGMSAAIGRWEMLTNSLFLLCLQLVGINLSGAVVFRVAGLSARGARYDRGKPWLFPVVLGAVTLALAGLLTLQFVRSPHLQRTSIAQRADTQVQKAVERSGLAELVHSQVQFTRTRVRGQNTLLVIVYVQPATTATVSSETIRERLSTSIQQRLVRKTENVVPLVQVSVLEPPRIP